MESALVNSSFLSRLRKSVEGSGTNQKPAPGASVPTFTEQMPLSSPQQTSPVESMVGADVPSTEQGKYLPYIIAQFDKTLLLETISIETLRKISWNGIPSKYRSDVWKMLLGYVPLKRERREETLKRKRKDYLDSVPLYFSNNESVDRSTTEGEIRRQILVDLPRTCPNNPFFHQVRVRQCMERILYIWSIRHPASSYVQGMNDLLTPLLIVCAQSFMADPARTDFAALNSFIMVRLIGIHSPAVQLKSRFQDAIEADAYWCFSKLMENIQDHYTFAQPGLQRMVSRLEDLTRRLDLELHNHLVQEGVQYVQFAFRWMNCALVREMPLHAIIRLWDTYLAEEGGGFENFHVYVCVVILKSFRHQLMEKSFQDILMFLQEMPTSTWNENEVEPVLSQAYILSNLFENAPSHLRTDT